MSTEADDAVAGSAAGRDQYRLEDAAATEHKPGVDLDWSVILLSGWFELF